jgi:hypothetical protein
MGKKCIMCCEEEAVYKIKDTSDCYCKECAKEIFSDLTVLVKVEEEAKRLQKFLEEKIDTNKLNDEAKLGEEKKEIIHLKAEDDDDEEAEGEEE